jgi:hypothetical protein
MQRRKPGQAPYREKHTGMCYYSVEVFQFIKQLRHNPADVQAYLALRNANVVLR